MKRCDMRMDPRLKSYCQIAGIIFAGAFALLLAGAVLLGCKDGPDLRTLDAAPAALVAAGCDPPPLADAGAPDSDFVPICPLCGQGGFSLTATDAGQE